MRVRKRLLVGSLLVSAVASAAIGWAIAASGDGGRGDDTVVIDGSDVTFQQPSLGTNAAIEGDAFPTVEVQTLQGDAFATAELVGQPLVVNIWGSTCGPCKAELADFAAVHIEYGEQVRFVGIDFLPPSDREEEFARDRGVQYELYYDTNGEFITTAGISAFPVTLFVTADGTIIKQTGQLDADRLRSLIESDLL